MSVSSYLSQDVMTVIPRCPPLSRCPSSQDVYPKMSWFSSQYVYPYPKMSTFHPKMSILSCLSQDVMTVIPRCHDQYVYPKMWRFSSQDVLIPRCRDCHIPRYLSHSVHYSRMFIHHFTAHCQRWGWVISCCWGSMCESRPMDKAFTGRLEVIDLLLTNKLESENIQQAPLVGHLLFSTLALELQINNHFYFLVFL